MDRKKVIRDCVGVGRKVLTGVLCMVATVLPEAAAYGSEPVDSIADRELDEIVVKADNVTIGKDGSQILLLSKSNREFGTNALDAISSINRFKTDLNATKLVSWDNSDVFVLINGVPSTAVDLRSYQADDIRRVEYYEKAPAQYMVFTTGPLVNVITRKRIDRLYSAYFNLNNAVNVGYGTDQLDLTYADSLNQVKAGYFADYRIFHGTDNHSSYIYGPGEGTVNYGTQRHRWVNQKANLSYQRYEGSHLFNARVALNSDPATVEGNTSSLIQQAQTTLSAESGNRLQSDVTTVSVDLYYSKMFSNGSMFAANVSNGFGTSWSDSRIYSFYPAPYESGNYDLSSSSDNHTYNLNATALFVTFLGQNQLSFANAFWFNRLSQHSAGETSIPRTYTDILNAGYARKLGQFMIHPTVGARLSSQLSGGMSLTRVNPYVILYGDWWGEGRSKGWTTQLTLSLFSSSPRLGDLAPSPTWIDRRFISMGNPDLNANNLIAQGKLAFGYLGTDGKKRAMLLVMPEYRHNPFVTMLLPAVAGGEDLMVMQPRTIGSVFTNFTKLNISWDFFNCLEVNPYAELMTTRYTTPTFGRVSSNYFRAGGSLTFKSGNFEATGAINSPTKSFDGDLVNESGMQWALKAQYKWRNWSFGANFNYVGGSTVTTGRGRSFIDCSPAPGSSTPVPAEFVYTESQTFHPRSVVSLSVTCYLSKGRVRQQGQKMLSSSGADNGLTKQTNARSDM